MWMDRWALDTPERHIVDKAMEGEGEAEWIEMAKESGGGESNFITFGQMGKEAGRTTERNGIGEMAE
jgi:hypothetical protein